MKTLKFLLYNFICVLLVCSICGCDRNEVVEYKTALMEGESFCLCNTESKSFYRTPISVDKVYGYDEEGNEIVYEEGNDYIVENAKIKRTEDSTIPDYDNHTVVFDENGKFDFLSEPRNPELNVRYQIKVDYTYEIVNQDEREIDDKSQYLSESTKNKLLNKDDLKIIVAGDSIASAAQTTAQYYRDDRISDGFTGLLESALEDYYGCTIDMSLFSEGGADRYLLLNNIGEVISQNPDIVIIEFGMNDHAIDDPLQGLISFKADMENIVETFQKEKIDVILVGFFQQNAEWNMESLEATEKYNETLGEIAKDKNIYFADVKTKFEEVSKIKNIYEDVTADYMHHPSDWGHKL